MEREEEIEKLTEMAAQIDNIADTQTKLVNKLDKFTEEYMDDKSNSAINRANYERDKEEVIKEKDRFIADIKNIKERLCALEFRTTENQASIFKTVKGKIVSLIINVVVFLIGLGFISWLTGLIGE